MPLSAVPAFPCIGVGSIVQYRAGDSSFGPPSPVEGEAQRFAAGEDKVPWGTDPPSEVGVMILERLTAWTLVALYYCVGCGVILLGLRGAL